MLSVVLWSDFVSSIHSGRLVKLKRLLAVSSLKSWASLPYCLYTSYSCSSSSLLSWFMILVSIAFSFASSALGAGAGASEVDGDWKREAV